MSTFIAGDFGDMRHLAEAIYSMLHRKAASPTAYFNLLHERVSLWGHWSIFDTRDWDPPALIAKRRAAPLLGE